MHTPEQSIVQGRGGEGRTGHAVVTEAEAARTDLEAPVVWLLMGIREETVMRGLTGKWGRTGQRLSVHNPGSWASTLWGADSRQCLRLSILS